MITVDDFKLFVCQRLEELYNDEELWKEIVEFRKRKKKWNHFTRKELKQNARRLGLG